MAEIWVNGDKRPLEAGATVGTLLEALGLAKRGGLAVEVNAAVVPRSEHGVTLLREGDRVEVVTMIAGG